MKFLFQLLLLIIFPICIEAQPSKTQSQLTIEKIMQGENFIGHSPENPYWINTTQFQFLWQNPEDSIERLYTYNISSKKLDTLTKKAIDTKEIINGKYYLQNGDIYKIEDPKATKATKELLLDFHHEIREIFPAENSESFFFQSENQIYEYQKGKVTLTANFIYNVSPADKPLEETNSKTKENVYLGISSPDLFVVSENGKHIFIRQSEYLAGKPTFIMNYLSEDGYSKAISTRSKVGHEEPNHTLKLYNSEQGNIYTIDFSSLPKLEIFPKYLQLYSDTIKYARKIVPHAPIFSKNNEFAVCDIRSYDNKDRWIVLINSQTGTWKLIDHQHDEAWIGGPGISGWNTETANLDWIDNNKFYFQSEISGFSHLYVYDVTTQKKSQLTSGNFEVHEVKLMNNKKSFYIQTNRSHPGNRDIEILNFDGTYKTLDLKSNSSFSILNEKLVTKIAGQSINNMEGKHEFIESPDGNYLIDLYSNRTHPTEIFLYSIKQKSTVKITKSTTKEFDSYNWYSPEVISFKANDGVSVYARIFQPEVSNNRAIIFVHGAGYLQNAHNYWSSYYREYMFHNFLRDLGYTILDIDYRASEGYGGAYRTAIYRNMGGRDLDDILEGKKYLQEKFQFPTENIGIYGGSYGGFITIMAMLKYPDEFKTGAALRSVTDWSHYNHEYTSNILNYPNKDSIAYRQSSPIFLADKLEGNLLMLHGMLDDNVHYQDVVRLSQAFIDNQKHSWQLIGYPKEKHSFQYPNSWIDEYTRIFEHFQKYLFINEK